MSISISAAAVLSGIPRSTLQRFVAANTLAVQVGTGVLKAARADSQVVICVPVGAVRWAGSPWQFDEAIVRAIGAAGGEIIGGSDLIPNFLEKVRASCGVSPGFAIGSGRAGQSRTKQPASQP